MFYYAQVYVPSCFELPISEIHKQVFIPVTFDVYLETIFVQIEAQVVLVEQKWLFKNLV